MNRIGAPYAVATAGVVIAAVVLVVAVLSLPGSRHEDLMFEAAKAAIQAFPLAFFGVVVADLVRRRDERRTLQRRDEDLVRETAQKRDEIRRLFLNEVIATYNRAKGIRRSLRGAGLGPTGTGPITEEQLRQLDLQLAGLSEAQLDFERLRREVDARGDVFTKRRLVRDALTKLEQYVSQVIHDWEKGRSTLTAGSSVAGLGAWLSFRAFVANRGEGGDFDEAARPMKAIEEAIWPDLLGWHLTTETPPRSRSGST